MVNKKKKYPLFVRGLDRKISPVPRQAPSPGVSLPLTVMMDDITLLRLYAAF